MYKVETDQTLRRLMQIYYWFGIWGNGDVSAFRKRCMRLLYLIQQSSFCIFFVIFTLLSGDNNEQIFFVEIEIVISVELVKCWYLLYRKDEILQFLNDPIVTHCNTDYDEWMEVNKKNNKFSKFIKVYSWALAAGILINIPVALPIFASEKKLPLFIPFDFESDYDTVFYWLAFVYISISCFCCAIYTLATVFLWYIMFNYAIEYKLLRNKFRRLGYATTEMRKKSTANSFHRDLIDLICVQINLVKYERLIDKFYAKEN